ncbi:MAG: N-acetyl-gamma-glutamyl-phosphate reductase [Clostridiales bacterium]|jgi:N-acetyl-gamma-glutamyl-phosphate reductase|nr:N-acetyl-gamma-glutamyl-phosphate reductase [Clostridiales bacterium]
MIKVGVIGATGYGGGELVRLLAFHPAAKVRVVTSRSYIGKAYHEVFENFRHDEDLMVQEENIAAIAKECDAVFLALPHGAASRMVTEDLLRQTRIIDFGADFRLSDPAVYEKWYKVEHGAKDLLRKAVYGLSEIYRERVRAARLIANPGCYTTCGILALYPLIRESVIHTDGLIIDAKSGVSGAGRGLDLGVHYDEANENVRAYQVGCHRHTPELEEQLSLAAAQAADRPPGQPIVLTFTPHMVPMNRGILLTAYARLTKDYSYEEIHAIYERYYGKEYFIRLTKKGISPETKWVKASNFCDIGFTLDERTGRLIVIAALDNLVKGAAGQAVQNMNLMFGLEEKAGLELDPVFPA